MECQICSSKNIKIIYHGVIRDGGLGQYTQEPITMHQCNECNVIWHDRIIDNKEYYESQKYRKSLEGTSEEDDFYHLHDNESLNKFEYTGTDIFRNKVVADIGCGCGAFLDFVSGVADEIIAVEPSETYRKIMDRKGYCTYAYAREAMADYSGKTDVITSFDVIEHVDEPQTFIREVYDLLKIGGHAIIGTPTETPVMRKLLGNIYEKELLFSIQHIWILGEKNLKILAENVGFKKEKIGIKYFQRYGLENVFGWLREKKPKSDINENIISETMNLVWKSECNKQGMSDYIVLYLEK